MALGIHRKPGHFADLVAGQRIEQGDAFDLLVKQLYPHRFAVRLGGKNINHITPSAVIAPLQLHVIAGVLQLGQTAQDVSLADRLATRNVQDHLVVTGRIAQAIN